ncbi:phosphatidate cytidylyltransferase [Anaerosphaera aminiphila DSM 21120]|uniref:Phosphatidate cytidylyltransferase n=1 Tax=Anaerosphaera aminiphila DSM 21120 TaxID=1120995 RepID=A0A1M5NZS7_9FIRM|nr:phosphatidate cytidylyltransferase [Anaerosphaera aminiphila]SHG95084.1 phosphatidate cytidylyltransferase [Anaerosphaera aminiphila DSM 21120]
MSDLKQRVLTGIVGLVLLFSILYLGGIYLRGAIFIISIIAILEFKNAFKNIKININMLPIIIGCISLFVFNIVGISYDFSIIVVLIISLIYLVFSVKYDFNSTAVSIFTFIYIPYSLNLLNTFVGTPFLLLVFIIAFCTDTFAYFVGSNFGKHKLLERVSPKKSIEGAIGGVLGAVLVSIVYFYFVKIPINLTSISLTVIASVAGQIGDLTASKIKRLTGIKDYGKILPGHGGIMDRFDSTIMVIPFVYILYFLLYLY